MSDLEMSRRLDLIADCAVRACLLEAGADKPGNISPGKDFGDTTYDDYVLGSESIRPVIREAALRGYCIKDDKDLKNVRIGELINDGVNRVRKSHGGGNTHLGILMLFVPIAAAAGFSYGRNGNLVLLQHNVRKVVESSTVEDALNLYDGIRAARPGGLGESEYDARDELSKERLISEGLTFYHLMRMSSERDRIAEELVNGMPIVFGVGAPMIRKLSGSFPDISMAVVQVSLSILANMSDTLIARKAGLEKAREVSAWAADALERGGIYTPAGKSSVEEFDRRLREDGNMLNPGTTADLIAASLFVLLLGGFHGGLPDAP